MQKFIFAIISSIFINVANASDLKITPLENMPNGIYKLDRTHSQLIWRVSHLGLSNYTARFTEFDAELDFNPKDFTKSKLNVTVNPKSIRTDYPYPDKKDFDAKLSNNKDWFNSDKYSKITFISKKISIIDKNTGTVSGDLTFMGVTKPIDLNVTFNSSMIKSPYRIKPVLGFSVTANLNRSNWGLKTSLPNIGDNVQLIIEAEFVRDKAYGFSSNK